MTNILKNLLQGSIYNFVGEVYTLRSQQAGDARGYITTMQGEALVPNDNHIVCGAEFVQDRRQAYNGNLYHRIMTWNLYIMKSPISALDVINVDYYLQGKEVATDSESYHFAVTGSQRRDENTIIITIEVLATYDPKCLCCN
jgi:hypothetical protein